MTMHTFQVCERYVERDLPCSECGKIVRRRFKGEATYNPFNDGHPPEQAQASAERAANKAEADGVTCQWCAERPYREALVAFAKGEPLPERKYGNPTDILIDRGNVEEIIDTSLCPHCGQHQWNPQGFRLTAKGARLAQKLEAKIAAPPEQPS